MSKQETISRYNFIIKKVKKSPCTFEEIAEYLSREGELQSYNFNTSKRTFQRDLDDIRALFDIDIQYDFKRRVYFIYGEELSEANERILEAFDTFNALNVSDRLSKYIHFEKQKPQGTENLYGILHAIKNRFQINFTYKKFWEETEEPRKVFPLALKEFKNRWYIIAKDTHDEKIKSFGLDRLSDFHVTKKKFQYPTDFNLEETFKHSFGIINPNGQTPQEIILSFDPTQGKYIKSLPLHTSQQIISDTKNELQIKLYLCITYDFVMELLSFGETVKVEKPKSLAKEIRTAHLDAYRQYAEK